MNISDRIYGSFKINEPVLADLLGSPSMQRLKGINQLGLPDRYYHQPGFFRYEHCVGVMLLLRKLGADLEEQVAGLLHDVSHTAFSHIADYIFGTMQKEDYQDSQLERFICTSELADILIRHGFDPQRIRDHHLFPLLEQEKPALCADRVDYALREMTDESLRNQCVVDLAVHNGLIVFSTEASALAFALHFLERERNNWGSFEAVSRYTMMTAVFHRAVQLGVLEQNDLWKTDEDVIEELLKREDPYIGRVFTLFAEKDLRHLPKTADPVYKKVRYVDPMIVEGTRVRLLSEKNATFRAAFEQLVEERSRGIFPVDPAKI